MRFPVCVSNPVQLIRDYPNISQCKQVETHENPADDTSRGLSSQQMVTNKYCLDGSAFVMKQEVHWPEQARTFIQSVEVNNVVDVIVTSINGTAAIETH